MKNTKQPKRNEIWMLKGILAVRIVAVEGDKVSFHHHGAKGIAALSAFRPATREQFREYLGKL